MPELYSFIITYKILLQADISCYICIVPGYIISPSLKQAFSSEELKK